MITTFNNRNVQDMKLICCPVCSKPMSGSKNLPTYITFYKCNSCQEKFERDNYLMVDMDIYSNEGSVWISVMDIYLDQYNIRQDNMENESEYTYTTIYLMPEDFDGTWVEIVTIPMLEFDILDRDKLLKKIRTYITFS